MVNAPPLVLISNVAEAFYDFLSLDQDAERLNRRVRDEQSLGDRALFWCGDPKLVVGSLPIPSVQYVQQTVGLHGTSLCWPVSPSWSLCNDILNESRLIDQIVSYGKESGTIELIPYASTIPFMHLAQSIEAHTGLRVITPETPLNDDLWLVQHLDTKLGFRTLVAEWLQYTQIRLPEGFVCQTLLEAGQAIRKFAKSNRPCIVKANQGEGGLGNVIFSPEQLTRGAPEAILSSNRFFDNRPIIVEEYIHSQPVVSPSFEAFVPRIGAGSPYLTYVSIQRFDESGAFSGVLISNRLEGESWYAPLTQAGLHVAHKLQDIGFAGHFDMDTIVSADGTIYALEVNMRRTGGTHVHEFAQYTLGTDYLDRVSIASCDVAQTGHFRTFEGICAALGDFLYPVAGRNVGIIPSISSRIDEGIFGYFVLGSTETEIDSLERAALDRLNS